MSRFTRLVAIHKTPGGDTFEWEDCPPPPDEIRRVNDAYFKRFDPNYSAPPVKPAAPVLITRDELDEATKKAR